MNQGKKPFFYHLFRRSLFSMAVLWIAAGLSGCGGPPPVPDELNINTADNFPDPNFRRAAERFVGVGREENFSAEMAAAQTGLLDCRRREIESLKGLEFFPNISGLNCTGNRLRELDLSANPRLKTLECSENQLTALDLSGNPELEKLIFDHNQLVSLDLSGLPRLREVDARVNRLESLDVSNNPALEILGIEENQVTSIDVSGNPALLELYCSMNRLERIDVGANTRLTRLDIDANEFEDMPDLTGLAALETLDMRWNYFDCGDWDSFAALRENLDEPSWGWRKVEYGRALRSGLAYSPQRTLDPYECPDGGE